MPVVATVEQEVVLARRVAETIFTTRTSPTFCCSSIANANDAPLLPHYIATISGCSPRRGGGCLLSVCLERSFMQRASGPEPIKLYVQMHWEVEFAPTYPADPCVWRIVRRAASGNPMALRPFVVDDIMLCLEASSRARRTGTERPSDVGLSLASPFVVDVALLCGFWAALELDEHCFEPVPRAGAAMMHSASLSTAMGKRLQGGEGGKKEEKEEEQEEEEEERDNDQRQRHRKGRDALFMARSGRNAVRQPRRAFAAVMAPNGRVIMWGAPRHVPALVGSAARNSNTTSPRCTYVQQSLTLFTSVPSRVETANTQFETKHGLNDVWLCADDACVALRHNARLCHATSALHGAAAAFRLLRRLMRAAPPQQPELYAREVLAPALVRVVIGLLQRRQPFWAGAAVCCVLLPGVLDDRTTLSLAVVPHLVDYPECRGCVSLVTNVFEIAGLPLKYREAESVRGAMEMLWRAKVSSMSVHFLGNADSLQAAPIKAISVERKTSSSLCSVGACHIPMAECAVCGLSLQRNDAFGDFDSGLKSANDCHTLQCARCGHGGHVAHIIGWWEDRSDRCCPKGCDCLCIY